MHPRTIARADPHRPAIILSGTDRWQSYGELVAGANRLGRYLRGLGLERGDHIALLLENHLRYFELVWAALDHGYYVTPISTLLTPAELGHILSDSGARMLVTSSRFAATVDAARAYAPTISTVLMLDGVEGDAVGYEAVVDTLDPQPLPDQSQGALMLYSSGTTGRPKGIKPALGDGPVEAPHPLSATLATHFALDANAVYLSTGPLYHAAPLKWNVAVQSVGGTCVVMPRFDAEGALAAIQAQRVTHSQWVPTMFQRLLTLPDAVRQRYDLSSHRRAIHAAAPCPIETKRRMLDWWGPIVDEYYAGTESVGLCVIHADEWLDRPGSVGRSVRGPIHIMAEDGEAELDAGEVGIIFFEGGTPFAYHNDPAKTQAARNSQGWVGLGDMGHLDADGYLYLADRRDDLILAGGVNIYPREVEEVLAAHPAVVEAAVVGAPDPEYGETVCAFVELGSGYSAEVEQELREWCAARLARFKHPRRYAFVEALPRLPTGKLLRRELRARLRG